MPILEGEEKLREINKRILDNAPVSIVTIDKEGYITSANKYYFNFSKTTDYRNHNIFESVFFIRENLVDDYKKLLSDGTVVRKEKCYERNNKGEDKFMKIVAVPLRDEHGNIEGALSMASDDTEAVMYKNKLEELNKSLKVKVAQRTAELREANKELAKVLESKVAFMADVSHELRTSLAIVQGNLELMDLVSSAEKGCAEERDQIFKEIKRMSVMLADLTLLAKSDSSVQKMNYEKIDLNRLISSLSKSLEVVAQENNVKIEHKNIGTKVEITADKSKIEKLLMNLIRNAIKYNKKNGWVNIWVEGTEGEAVLKVEDSGIGIAEDHLPHIFERFYRVDKDKPRNDGSSGLGLAICKRIAEAHGGKIEVESKIGQGSLFTVCLPRKRKK